MKRVALCAALAIACAASEAHANGRFPAAGHIAVDPGDPQRLLVRTTYGLLTTTDGGADWDWICEQAVGWTAQYDPSIAITKSGAILVGIYDHLGLGTEAGCAWAAALDGKNVVDVSTRKDDSHAAVVLTSKETASDVFETQVWASSNDGGAWSQLGVNLPSDFVGLTLDAAPADPQRLYLSGQIGKSGPGVLERSIDGGAAWERLTIPGSDADHAPYIAAIDPADTALLYVRLAGSPGRLLVSKDGGDSWQEAFTGAGLLKGFALSPDGSALLVGGDADGVHRVSTADLTETRVSDVKVQCLAWAATGVYACAGELADGFTVGQSSDEGATFTPLNHLACVRGPLQCGAATEVGAACPAAWPATAATIDWASCFGEPDAGTGGGQGGGGGAAAKPLDAEPIADEGCNVAVVGAGGGGAFLAALVALAGWRPRKAGRRPRG